MLSRHDSLLRHRLLRKCLSMGTRGQDNYTAYEPRAKYKVFLEPEAILAVTIAVACTGLDMSHDCSGLVRGLCWFCCKKKWTSG